MIQYTQDHTASMVYIPIMLLHHIFRKAQLRWGGPNLLTPIIWCVHVQGGRLYAELAVST